MPCATATQAIPNRVATESGMGNKLSTKQEIIAHIEGYMCQFQNTENFQWYVGIASDVRQRLFSDHGVSEESGQWTYMLADSSDNARAVEKAYLDIGCSGSSGGGDSTTTIVYVYLKSSRTNP